MVVDSAMMADLVLFFEALAGVGKTIEEARIAMVFGDVPVLYPGDIPKIDTFLLHNCDWCGSEKVQFIYNENADWHECPNCGGYHG